ncbi:hypothetical protein [Streptomyces sp. VRA16 Mangrove soil]|uniref:hypothetical protein n=1 Tax=Streptomyces sp. VRA16 Mangrove soil TaxID=2817434 RepID=UPI001A9F87CB|nr:hypothetical protein [Streptomyces sp. VRA16 Mangrove soil]MBO1333786.1 hypothetical protein [Streptomyces sp. VRA16 Mangrove soil]
MTATDLEKARKAAEAAAAKLAEAEAAEAEKAAQQAAERLEAEKEAAARFLEDRRDLEEKVRGSNPSAKEKAEAFKAGTLAELVVEYLSRREAVSALRTHAQECARLLGLNPYELGIDELRWVDPNEELRRWQEEAMPLVLRDRADALSAEALAPYEVD